MAEFIAAGGRSKLRLHNQELEFVSSSFSLEPTVETLDTTTFADEWRTFQPGLRTGSFTVTGFLQKDHKYDAVILDTIRPIDKDETTYGADGQRWFQFFPSWPGDTAALTSSADYGDFFYAAGFITESLSIAPTVGAVVEFSFTARLITPLYTGYFIANQTRNNANTWRNVQIPNNLIQGNATVTGSIRNRWLPDITRDASIGIMSWLPLRTGNANSDFYFGLNDLTGSPDVVWPPGAPPAAGTTLSTSATPPTVGMRIRRGPGVEGLRVGILPDELCTAAIRANTDYSYRFRFVRGIAAGNNIVPTSVGQVRWYPIFAQY